MQPTAENQNTMEFLLDVPVKLTVELGNCEMTMKDLLQLGIGADFADVFGAEVVEAVDGALRQFQKAHRALLYRHED